MHKNTSLGGMHLIQYDDLFFFAYTMLFLSEMVSSYTNLADLFGGYTSLIVRILYYSFLGVCALCFLSHNTIRATSILAICLVLLVGLISYHFSGSHVFMDTLVLICIAKDVDFEKFMKRMVIFLAVFVIMIIALSNIGAISTVIKERAVDSQIRNSLGFSHPNTLGLLVFQFIAGVIVVEGDKLRVFHICLLFGIGLIFYAIERSRTSIVEISLLLVTVFLYSMVAKKLLTRKQIMRVIEIIGVIVIIILIFAFRYFIENPEELAYTSLAARIRLATKYLNAYGINLFGHEIVSGAMVALPGYSAGYSYLDNAEVWYLVKFGIVGFCVIFYLYIRMIKHTIDNNDNYILMVSVIYLIYSLVENITFRIPFNFMLVYMAISFYQNRSHYKIKFYR